MSDYYSILGLTKTATTAEIKVAYRRLVKIYHPDKNPNYAPAVEKFRQIQTAYDTLADPVKRARYDNKLSGGYGFGEYTYQSPKPKTKNYSFTEEDLKKRQYYKEHYKQHSTANKKKTDPTEEKKVYNEVKYILISIPLAVALLFFIINIYSKKEPEQVSLPSVKKSTSKLNDTLSKQASEPKIKTSDEPYNYFFGNAKVDKGIMQVLQVTNWSGSDAVVCVVDSKTGAVVRNYFIEDRFNILFEYLPEGTYFLKTYIGKEFRSDTTFADQNILSLFANEQQFQEHHSDSFTITLSKHDTIQRDIIRFKDTTNKVVTDYKKFFGI